MKFFFIMIFKYYIILYIFFFTNFSQIFSGDILTFIEEEMRKNERKIEKGGERKTVVDDEEKELKEARLRLTMGKERRILKGERPKFASSTI